jgi:hypothetical protein
VSLKNPANNKENRKEPQTTNTMRFFSNTTSSFEFRKEKIEMLVQNTKIQSLGRFMGSIIGGRTTSVASAAVRTATLWGWSD